MVEEKEIYQKSETLSDPIPEILIIENNIGLDVLLINSEEEDNQEIDSSNSSELLNSSQIVKSEGDLNLNKKNSNNKNLKNKSLVSQNRNYRGPTQTSSCCFLY